MNNNKGSLAGFTAQRSRLIIWGLIGLVLMSNLGAIIDSFLHPEIEYFDLEHIIVGGATALVFGIMFLMLTRYLDRFEKTVSDISQSEKALRESEEKLKTIIETSPDGIATSTLDGKIQFVTEKLVSIFGYASTDELIGRDVMEFIHSSDQEKMGYLINELLNGHLTGPAECLLVKKDGSLFYAEANANILCDAGKNPIGILYLERNITERKKAEALLRESEERYRLLHDSSLDGIMLTAPDGRIFSANASACHMLGRTEEEIIQAGRNGVVDTTDPNLALAIEERSRTGKFIGELTFIRKSGEKFPVELSSSLFTDRDDNTRTSLTFHDITERKQAEDKLRESEERYRFLTNNIPDIIYSLDGEGNIVTVNSPAFEHYGYIEQDSKGKPFLNFVHPEDREIVIGSFLKALEEQRKFTQGLQFRIVAENGFSYWFELNSQARFDNQGQYTGEEGVLRDITERKLAEEKLINSEASYRRLFEAAKDGILILDAETGVILDVNPFLLEILGSPKEDICGKELWELGFFKDIAANKSNFLELQQKEYIRYEDLPLETTHGRRLNVEFVSNVYEVDHRRVIQCNIRDITERKLTDEKLRESEQTLRNFITNSPDTMYVLDLENHTSKYLNCVEFCGYPKSTLESPTSIMFALHPDDLTIVQENWKDMLRASDGEVISCEYRLQRKDGVWEWIQQRMTILARTTEEKPSRILVTLSIVTERKLVEEKIHQLNTELEQRVEDRTRELREAQEKLVRHEKLVVLGQMSSSVGHELRNPLSVINSAIYYLKMIQPNAAEDVKEYLGIIDQEVRTAEKIITDLLDFSRIKSVDREAVSVSELIRRTLERFPVPESVAVTIDVPPDLPQVFVDVHHMTQVLGNLTVNACQAMTSPTAGAKIDGQLSLYSTVQNDMINITVKDNGVGISAENMKKIFEPLFTTKTKGIGLGLAVSQKLVAANEGRIEVESEAGKGTSFHVYLPIYGVAPVVARDEAVPVVARDKKESE